MSEIKGLLIRHPYTSPRKRVVFNTDGPSMTKQSMKDECDINNIMARFHKRGVLTHVNRFEGQYGEFGDGISFHQAQETLVKAQEAFDTLPAAIRSRFKNDPAEFLDFVNDEANREEMYDLGLADRPPQTGEPAAPAAAAASPAPEPSTPGGDD